MPEVIGLPFNSDSAPRTYPVRYRRAHIEYTQVTSTIRIVRYSSDACSYTVREIDGLVSKITTVIASHASHDRS